MMAYRTARLQRSSAGGRGVSRGPKRTIVIGNAERHGRTMHYEALSKSRSDSVSASNSGTSKVT